MALSQSQRSLIAKARVLGSGSDGFVLSDDVCCYLIAVIASDLGLTAKLPDLPLPAQGFFSTADIESLALSGLEFEPLIDRLFSLDNDADTYFACLANLHKRRLKYRRILRNQPLPTIDQVGPRAPRPVSDTFPYPELDVREKRNRPVSRAASLTPSWMWQFVGRPVRG